MNSIVGGKFFLVCAQLVSLWFLVYPTRDARFFKDMYICSFITHKW